VSGVFEIGKFQIRQRVEMEEPGVCARSPERLALFMPMTVFAGRKTIHSANDVHEWNSLIEQLADPRHFTTAWALQEPGAEDEDSSQLPSRRRGSAGCRGTALASFAQSGQATAREMTMPRRFSMGRKKPAVPVKVRDGGR
jgi:hypothetical protein